MPNVDINLHYLNVQTDIQVSYDYLQLQSENEKQQTIQC